MTAEKFLGIRDCVLRYTENLRIKNQPYGRYRYSSNGTLPLLYASVYAALLRHLLDDLDNLSREQRWEWINYINSFQCEDGLYRDPLLNNDIAETQDWWGWRHLTAHVVTALTCLGGRPHSSFVFLKSIYGENISYEWVSKLPWHIKPENVSNTVMNYGVLLQYERDSHDNKHAANAINRIFSFLDETMNPDTGLWGNKSVTNKFKLSAGVQTSYHLWNLYFYDNRPISHMDKAIDNCLATQNTLGGYGVALNSSACEDIDSIDPLCRFYYLTNYRRNEIESSLKKALSWIPANLLSDGGMAFNRFSKLVYGHELMTTEPDESHLFATWFRILSMAYISHILRIPGMQTDVWKWVKCPGYQFWH